MNPFAQYQINILAEGTVIFFCHFLNFFNNIFIKRNTYFGFIRLIVHTFCFHKHHTSKKWVKVKTIKNTKTLTYLDKKTKKGKKYRYRVKAYYKKSYSYVKSSKTLKR